MGGARKPVVESLWLEPAIASLAIVLTLVLNREETSPAVWLVETVTCVGAGVSYRFPVAGAALVSAGLASWFLLPGTWPGVSGLAFVINVFAAVRKGFRWRVPLTIGLTGLAYLVLVERSVQSAGDRPGPTALVVSMAAIAWIGGALWRRGRLLLTHERERAALEQAELRLSLARDLHDTVAQTLTHAAIGANLVLAEPDLPTGAREELERVAAECRSSAHDLRQLLGALRGQHGAADPVVPMATVESLRNAVDEQVALLRDAGLSVDLELSVRALSAARAHTMTAAAREATNNMRKHAPPHSHCQISISDEGDDVVARFVNPRTGRGEPGDGLGLIGIRERLALLGGSSRTVQDAGRWELIVRLPHGVN